VATVADSEARSGLKHVGLKEVRRSKKRISATRTVVHGHASAGRWYLEFFAAEMHHDSTRRAYRNAVAEFLTWCEARGVGLYQIEANSVAAYVDGFAGRFSAGSIKSRNIALAAFFDWLVAGDVFPSNPALQARVRTHASAGDEKPPTSAMESERGAPLRRGRRSSSGARVPVVVSEEGELACRWYSEFFSGDIRFFAGSMHTGRTGHIYRCAVRGFLDWCDGEGIRLQAIGPGVIADYIEALRHRVSAGRIRQHLSAIRLFFDWLAVGQVVTPARAVPVRCVVGDGRVVMLPPKQAAKLLESLDPSTITGLRDRALFAVLVHGIASIEAVRAMRVSDYHRESPRAWLHVPQWGGYALPVQPGARRCLDAYIDAAGIAGDGDGPLFRTTDGHGRLRIRAMTANNALEMVKRHATFAGLPEKTGCETLRATGIAAYLANGGTIEGMRALIDDGASGLGAHEESDCLKALFEAVGTIVV
jgi:site-specific recombinase XerD